MNMKEFHFWMVLLLIAGLGCRKDQDAAILPIYVQIDTIAVNVAPGQGTDTHLITEIWVYADSVFEGAYHVPTTFPLLAEGMARLDLFAGIRVNGQGAQPDIYPFMSIFSKKIKLEALQTIEIDPVFNYHPKTQFSFVEDFETGNIFSDDIDQDPETQLVVSVENTKNRAAVGVVAASHPELEVATNFIYEDIPTDGSSVFFEMEYKGEIPLSVGLRGHQTGINPSTQYKLILVPQLEWQKVYINFSDDLKRSQLKGYQIIFRARFDGSIDDTEQKIFLDNLKLLHF